MKRPLPLIQRPDLLREPKPAKPFTTYPGSKDAGGAAEKIIALLPAHSVYVEPFLGNGAILRRKVPALQSIGIDLDTEVIERWRVLQWPALELIEGNGIAWLETEGMQLPPDALIYCDPPYLRRTRSKRQLYAHEMSDMDHCRLLAVAQDLPCSIVISGYPSDMYEMALRDFEHHTFQAMTRGGVRTEGLWIKRSIASFGDGRGSVGNDYRDRERIKRKVQRWRENFRAMREDERREVLRVLLQEYQECQATPPGVTMADLTVESDEGGRTATAANGEARGAAIPKP